MSDAGAFDKEAQPTVDLGALPEIVSVEVRLVTFEEPRIEYDGLEPKRHDAAIAFDVTTAEPFVARALGPAVFVGETPIVTFDLIGDNQYRFYAFVESELQVGAPITVGWIDTEPERRAHTGERFDPKSWTLRRDRDTDETGFSSPSGV